MMSRTRQLTTIAMFVAIGIIGAQFLWFPAGVAKAYPVQHMVNVLAAVLLGPFPAVLIAFLTSLLRVMLGLGTVVAFPGSIIGAFLAGMLYKHFGRKFLAMTGEIVGTGVFGSLFSVPIANLVMGSTLGALAFLPSFLVSSISGAILGYVIVVRVSHTYLQNS